jgi:cell volume regulation protein A
VNESLLFLSIGGVLAGSIVIALMALKIGVPSLVAFLILGMLLGAEGIGKIAFNNVEVARMVGTIGLVAILFEGGISTSWRRLREAALPAALLSTVGVGVTAALIGLASHVLFNLPWLHALLLGAVVSSTDAAAVFATLRFTEIRRRLARILEAETGLNDPAAIALTIGFISWIEQPTYGLNNLAQLLVHQISVGLLVGIGLGALSMWVFSRLPTTVGAFAPVASIATASLSFGIADILGGSGFLAVYLVGLAIGSTPSRYRSQLTTFHEGLAFLAQVAMFVILGLFVLPHQLLTLAGPSLILALLLVFIIRPIAVWFATPFSNFTARERALLGWAGLRGAVPIVLGTFILSSNINHGETIFNIVFFVVLISAIVQGTTLNWVAERLGVIDHLPVAKRPAVAINRLEKIRFYVTPQHAIVGAAIREIGLPPKASVISITRSSEQIEPTKKTIIQVGDTLVVSAPKSIHPEIDDVFTRWRRRI